ncbi:MAG: HD domain-containing protein, partial [Proteobacteria bacterium]|nr:HD domain-containing protein [Pseudomonadota bacterium]
MSETEIVHEKVGNGSKLKDPETLFKELAILAQRNVKGFDESVLRKAYEFAAKCHGDQKRQSGEPYVTHPLEVATIAAGFRIDMPSLIAALLHDVVEDTHVSLGDVEIEFGKVVAELVDGLTKIAKIEFRSNQEKLAENFRKMVIAMAKDLRVIVIKLADRLHNMRTIKVLPPAKRVRIAQETMDIYAPLANRLGIYGVKSELEDLCLRQL